LERRILPPTDDTYVRGLAIIPGDKNRATIESEASFGYDGVMRRYL
jgi:hypothetical protein